jgi:FMN-dependent NADH-azoreductase
MKLLHIDSSITGGPSASRQVSAEVVNTLKGGVPGLQVLRRDLELEPLPHLNSAMLAAGAGAAVDDATKAEVAKNEAVLNEFLGADAVVIGAPMYNFSIPSQLKAWIDRIAIAGKTFRYTQSGPEGLAGGKKVIVVLSRGGVYSEGPMSEFDFQERYLRTIFGFIGITDVEFVRIEGVALSPKHREDAISAGFAAAAVAGHKVAVALNQQNQKAA